MDVDFFPELLYFVANVCVHIRFQGFQFSQRILCSFNDSVCLECRTILDRLVELEVLLRILVYTPMADSNWKLC